MANKIKIGILGATGKTSFSYIAQKSMEMLENHPVFEIGALIADDPADAGKSFAEAAGKDRWLLDVAMPERWANLTMMAPDPATIKAAGIPLVLSAASGPVAKELDPIFAAGGLGVISESIGMRMEADVPLIVPGINADHLAMIEVQRKNRGWSGFVVSSPLCTAVIVALALKPLADRYGIASSTFTTMQAMSGNGRTGVAGMHILDNLLPFIDQEEEKLYQEVPKILGRFDGSRIVPMSAPLSATCTRVPVRDGHTIAMSVALENPAELGDIASAFASYEGRAKELGLHHAPAETFIVRSEVNRPQPLHDRMAGNGRTVSIGRLRPAPASQNGVSYVAVGHNHELGTYGNAVMLAELVAAEGLVS